MSSVTDGLEGRVEVLNRADAAVAHRREWAEGRRRRMHAEWEKGVYDRIAGTIKEASDVRAIERARRGRAGPEPAPGPDGRTLPRLRFPAPLFPQKTRQQMERDIKANMARSQGGSLAGGGSVDGLSRAGSAAGSRATNLRRSYTHRAEAMALAARRAAGAPPPLVVRVGVDDPSTRALFETLREKREAAGEGGGADGFGASVTLSDLWGDCANARATDLPVFLWQKGKIENEKCCYAPMLNKNAWEAGRITRSRVGAAFDDFTFVRGKAGGDVADAELANGAARRRIPPPGKMGGPGAAPLPGGGGEGQRAVFADVVQWTDAGRTNAERAMGGGVSLSLRLSSSLSVALLFFLY